ncbi:MAG TPA: hypothetical protein ENJ83_05245, partial [Rhodospirillales bacterium]|nr:hypothetical protein [Rhodospirillales bacterium]
QETAPAAVAEPSDGELARTLAGLCRRTGVGLALGYAERFAGRCHASLMVLSPEGRALANYRRTHLDPEEEGPFTAGNWLTLVPFAGRRFGLLAGADLRHPEPARVLALAGADALLTADAGGGPSAAVPRFLLAARALENRLPLLHAAFAPPFGPGASAFDASGEPIGEAGTGDLLAATIGRDGRRASPGWRRRPELYMRLTEIDG